MRFDFQFDKKPIQHEFDVIFSDTVGTPFNAFYPAEVGMGGTEAQIVWLAEGLAAAGYRVGVINRGPFASQSPAGVRYFPLGDLVRETISPKAEVLVSLRAGILPPGIEFNRLFFWLHDIPDDSLRGVHDVLSRMPDARVVCVSDWQAARCPEQWQGRVNVLHNMIPDWIYDVKWTPTVKNYVYLSAAQKGLDATLDVWDNLQGSSKSMRKSILQVAVPGYDRPDEKRIKRSRNVYFGGSHPLWRVVHMLKESSGGLFYVNIKPETFGIVPVMAEIIGAPCRVLCVNDPGALDEVTNCGAFTSRDDFERSLKSEWNPNEPQDFRVSTQVPKWIKLLELNKEKNESTT
jgi:hypothetical protein